MLSHRPSKAACRHHNPTDKEMSQVMTRLIDGQPDTRLINTNQTPYRAVCTECTELKAELAKQKAKKPRAKYKFELIGTEDGDNVGTFFVRVFSAIGGILAIALLLDGAGFASLFAWPVGPAVLSAHCLRLRRVDEE